MRLKPKLIVITLLLQGCSLAPAYKTPSIGLPAAFHEPGWQAAKPAVNKAQLTWEVFQDPTLNRLQRQLADNNPDLRAALAHYDAAMAYAAGLDGQQAPQVDATGSSYRQRQSDDRPLRGADQPSVYNSNTLMGGVSFDLDLWGRLRNMAIQGHAQADAFGSDYAAARQSLQGHLSVLYMESRGLDQRIAILNQRIDSYRQMRDLIQRRYEGKITTELELVRAEHQVSDALARREDARRLRARAVHAIAQLVGQPAGQLALQPDNAPLALPVIPQAVPSVLLQQRPDISAAERRAYAANAGIGIARAAQYPDISLTGQIGGQTTGSGSLLAAGNRYWALGPLIHLPLFDGGRLEANEQKAVAEFNEASSRYRSTVLAAIREVEDCLSDLNHLAIEADNERDALVSAQRAQALAEQSYGAGAVSNLDVLIAQNAALQAELDMERVSTERLQSSARLITALGGRW